MENEIDPLIADFKKEMYALEAWYEKGKLEQAAFHSRMQVLENRICAIMRASDLMTYPIDDKFHFTVREHRELPFNGGTVWHDIKVYPTTNKKAE
jgi:hypothetical protein